VRAPVAQGAVSHRNRINSGAVLEKVCLYLMYKVRYANSSREVPEFPISNEIVRDLLVVRWVADLWSFSALTGGPFLGLGGPLSRHVDDCNFL
jgi:hypothetical protein